MNLTRDKAIEILDALVEEGYGPTIHVIQPRGYVMPHPETGDVGAHVLYRVTLGELGYDSVDLTALIAIGEEHGVELLFSHGVGGFHYGYPEEHLRVIHGERKHPRRAKS